jgi:hypothetical protein
MSSVVISGDTSGAITVAAPAVAGTNTATLPAATGTVMVSGNMPAFSAYASSNQSIANNTAVKIQLNTEVFDTANCFDSTTNYRFTPTVAGYYQINAAILYNTGSSTGTCQAKLWKNGADYKTNYGSYTSQTIFGTSVCDVVYMNGTTDYLELYTAQSSGGTQTTAANSLQIYMSGCLVRTA